MSAPCCPRATYRLTGRAAGANPPFVHGWIVIDKPVGPGSTQIVGAVRRALREGNCPRVKVGHGGTLDPLASGVLPIALGEATKLSGRMLDADKVYEFTIAFGSETDTLDLEGKVVATSGNIPAPGDIEAVLVGFIGDIEQVPPAYSALKIDGKRAYELARAGTPPAMTPRKVKIHDISCLEEGVDDSGVRWATLEARVSKGTYIRSLARDIARAVESVGHVTMLRRTRAGPFSLEQAISLDKLGESAKGRSGRGAPPGARVDWDCRTAGPLPCDRQ
jgi:tRNA pseudouridine55 synthase